MPHITIDPGGGTEEEVAGRRGVKRTPDTRMIAENMHAKSIRI